MVWFAQDKCKLCVETIEDVMGNNIDDEEDGTAEADITQAPTDRSVAENGAVREPIPDRILALAMALQRAIGAQRKRNAN